MTTDIRVRRACQGDVPAMAALMARRRAHYERLQPVFWKRAGRAHAKTLLFYRLMMAARAATMLVAESDVGISGLLVARRTRVPPVYDPGGVTVTIDDFCVAQSQQWPTIGGALLSEVRERGRQAGWSQIVVVCGAADEPKTAFLRSTDLSLASTWWTAHP